MEGQSAPGNRRSRSPPSLALGPWETVYFWEKSDQIWDFGQKKVTIFFWGTGGAKGTRPPYPKKNGHFFFDQNPKFGQIFLKNTLISQGTRASLGGRECCPRSLSGDMVKNWNLAISLKIRGSKPKSSKNRDPNSCPEFLAGCAVPATLSQLAATQKSRQYKWKLFSLVSLLFISLYMILIPIYYYPAKPGSI